MWANRVSLRTMARWKIPPRGARRCALLMRSLHCWLSATSLFEMTTCLTVTLADHSCCTEYAKCWAVCALIILSALLDAVAFIVKLGRQPFC